MTRCSVIMSWSCLTRHSVALNFMRPVHWQTSSAHRDIHPRTGPMAKLHISSWNRFMRSRPCKASTSKLRQLVSWGFQHLSCCQLAWWDWKKPKSNLEIPGFFSKPLLLLVPVCLFKNGSSVWLLRFAHTWSEQNNQTGFVRSQAVPATPCLFKINAPTQISGAAVSSFRVGLFR